MKQEHFDDFNYRKTKAMLLVFLLEDNLLNLKTTVCNIRVYSGLVKSNVTVGIMGNIVKGKESAEPPHEFFKKKDAFYADEIIALERLSNNIAILNDALNSLPDYGVSMEEYNAWIFDHWRDIRIRFNHYKGAGCITAQAIQGMVISLANAGIAIGTKSPGAAAASVFYFVSTTAHIIETVARTHLENNLIRNARDPKHETTIPRATLAANLRKAHQDLQTLRKVETVVNKIDGLANSAFNLTGTMTSLPLCTGRPATTMPPVESISAPIVNSTHAATFGSGTTCTNNPRRGF